MNQFEAAKEMLGEAFGPSTGAHSASKAAHELSMHAHRVRSRAAHGKAVEAHDHASDLHRNAAKNSSAEYTKDLHLTHAKSHQAFAKFHVDHSHDNA